MVTGHFLQLFSLWSRQLSLLQPPPGDFITFLHTECKPVTPLLPVVVSYDGSQCSHAYSVAHQMDLLTQNVFNPAGSKKQHELLFAFLHQIKGGKKKNKGPTFRLAAVQSEKWGRRGGRHQWRQVLPWGWRKNHFTQTRTFLLLNSTDTRLRKLSR